MHEYMMLISMVSGEEYSIGLREYNVRHLKKEMADGKRFTWVKGFALNLDNVEMIEFRKLKETEWK